MILLLVVGLAALFICTYMILIWVIAYLFGYRFFYLLSEQMEAFIIGGIVYIATSVPMALFLLNNYGLIRH